MGISGSPGYRARLQDRERHRRQLAQRTATKARPDPVAADVHGPERRTAATTCGWCGGPITPRSRGSTHRSRPPNAKQTTKVICAGVARIHIFGSSLGQLTLDRIRPSHVEGWLVELRRKGLAESTIRSAYTILRAVLDTAVRDGALASNPAAVIRRPRVTAKEAPHLTPRQVAELLRAAVGTRYARLFALQVHTGLRRGAALALQWSDVDLRRGTLRVRGTLARVEGRLLVTEPKTAKSRRSCRSPNRWRDCSTTSSPNRPRSDERPALPGRRPASSSPPSSDSRATLATRSGRSRSWQPRPASGKRPCTRSATRRPAWMLTHGVPLKVVSEILGHSSIAITGDIYGHVAPDVSRQAVDILGDVLGR
jgi:integrase